jgi:hypothetical protein
MSYRSLLKHTATVARETITYGSLGQSERTWTSVATSVRCLVQPKRWDFISQIRGEEETARYVGFFEYGVTLTAGDRVIVSNSNGVEIAKFTVTHVPVDISGRMHHVEADLEFVDEQIYLGS